MYLPHTLTSFIYRFRDTWCCCCCCPVKAGNAYKTRLFFLFIETEHIDRNLARLSNRLAIEQPEGQHRSAAGTVTMSGTCEGLCDSFCEGLHRRLYEGTVHVHKFVNILINQ